jgi:hypothetical protein
MEHGLEDNPMVNAVSSEIIRFINKILTEGYHSKGALARKRSIVSPFVYLMCQKYNIDDYNILLKDPLFNIRQDYLDMVTFPGGIGVLVEIMIGPIKEFKGDITVYCAIALFLSMAIARRNLPSEHELTAILDLCMKYIVSHCTAFIMHTEDQDLDRCNIYEIIGEIDHTLWRPIQDSGFTDEIIGSLPLYLVNDLDYSHLYGVDL